MLVLNRKLDERLIIGKTISVLIQSIDEDEVSFALNLSGSESSGVEPLKPKGIRDTQSSII